MLDLSRLDPRPQPHELGAREAEGTEPSPSKRSPLARFVLFVLLAAAVTFLLSHAPGLAPVVYQPGDIAQEDVKASGDFLVEDNEGTDKRRREAELGSPAVYDYDPGALAECLALLEDGLKVFSGRRVPDRGALRALEAQWGVRLDADLVERLFTSEGRQLVIAGVRSALEGVYGRGVAANRSVLVAEQARGVIVRDLRSREEGPLQSPEAVEDFDRAKERLADSAVGPPLRVLARRLAAVLLRPNLTYNGEETTRRRAAARSAVNPIMYQVRTGEMLVREGDRVTREQARKLEAHGRLVGQASRWQSWIGVFLLAALLLSSAYDFGRSNVKKFRAERRDVLFLASVLLTWLFLERIGILVATGIRGLAPAVPMAALLNALPLGASVMVVRAVLNSESALIFCLPFCALASLPFDNSLATFCYFAVGGLVGAHRAARACRRIDFVFAGLWMGLAQAGAAFSIGFLDGWALRPGALWMVGGAFVGGLAGGFLALSVVPLVEGIFGYTTDMRLMELASLDHPLLKALMIRAPGTYYHSIVTGSLAKSAAEAIKARALLASVAAYYHDVGKLSKPAYFIENQSGGANRHDKLRPSMSSLILTSHVKEGVELARKHGLGRDITDIIRQHHGTGLIHYFYGKACQRARPGLDDVKESEYRYLGPKPRTREAALVLLADAVEAAARTVVDPRPARIQGLVQNIINRIFTDGQLDECDLTLSDLHRIARSFSRILTGIHHQRIDYPLAACKERRPHGDPDQERPRALRDRRGEAHGTGAEGLRRLGL